MFIRTLFLCLILLTSYKVQAQGCTTRGQTPSTAFPVCGTAVFEQKEVPLCVNRNVFVPGCSGAGTASYQDRNPFWYSFTCFESGTLGFLIKPKDPADDYDWQLYDITGLNPEDVYSDRAVIVAGNWAGNPGNTGASAGGVSYIQCGSLYTGSEPRFAEMPELKKGHQYLLMVSHFTNTQSGYDLSFGGGTAVITDTTEPDLRAVNLHCDASSVYVKVTKKVKCSSLAEDGSDFYIVGSDVNVVSATSFCKGFDTDSIILHLDRSLPPGDYRVAIRKGSDDNTLLDNCDSPIEEGRSLPFNIKPLMPTPMDSLVAPSCAAGELELVFEKKMRCSSIHEDGSNFLVTGPVPVQIAGVRTDCDGEGLTKRIVVMLARPLTVGGVYRITLQKGPDENTIIDECGQQTPAYSQISFAIKDTVNANFTYKLIQDCTKSDLQLEHDGRNGVNSWSWQLDYNGVSKLRNPQVEFPPYGKRNILLLVTNGFCKDSIAKEIDLGAALKADFETESMMCPEDALVLINRSAGKIVDHTWSFGDGSLSKDQTPAGKLYAMSGFDRSYQISLIVKSDRGCSDTATKDVKVLMTCRIAVPNAFTPNGDNLNDFLYPLNAIKADQMLFRVYNRLGQLVFESRDWNYRWDGTFKGEPQNAGIYAWTLQYVHRDTGKKIFLKGSTALIR